jgi:hypothetical protein
MTTKFRSSQRYNSQIQGSYMLKQGKSVKIEFWNGHKVYTVESNDVEFILYCYV